MKGRQTYILSTRVPDNLYLKVRRLAENRGMTVNDWLKNIIIAAAKFKEGKETLPPTTTALTIIKEASNG